MRASLASGLVGLGLLASGPPRLTLDDLGFLAGTWSGTLTYLDYADEHTRQTLRASLHCSRTDSAIEYRFSYVEPDGRAVEGDATTLTVDPDGSGLRLGGERWRVTDRRIDRDRARYHITAAREGTDADRPAEFRRTWSLEGDTLRIRTEVRLAGKGTSFVRNEHVLSRTGP